MKKKWLRRLLLILSAAILLILIGLHYKTRLALTSILRSSSLDGQYSLTVSMVGEPDFPFGATHCRFVLKSGSQRILSYDFDIHDDGANACEENFSVVWNDSSVSVTVFGSEQAPVCYHLSLDGEITREE